MNGQIDWQATADITSGLQLGRAEVLKGMRNFVNTDRPEHHSTDRERKEKQRKGFPPSEVGNDMHSTIQLHCFEGNLEESTERRAERVWALPALRCHLE